MSIASGGVAVRPPRRNVTSRLVRPTVVRSADAALAAGFVLGRAVGSVAGRGAGLAVGCGTGPTVRFATGCSFESVFAAEFVVGFDMDGPPSGM
ncbi:hypothetical protein [Streptomyces sp. Tu 3180]|uniref:hypothetical protein n=1 Tax=Streptomyces sp. Tu 3180 TaxID=2682611 RepID=UPI001FB58F37|nr:hypothetical protein [Streptomyces sp. Tu 3180]